MVTDPREQFVSVQDIVVPDIEQYYTKTIKDIDMFRSRFNAASSGIRETISLKNIDNVFVDNEMNSTMAQESRCNAFFRMIGFPVVAPDGSDLYSPGFDPDGNRDSEQVKTKLNIANAVLKKLQSVLDDRENDPKSFTKIFQAKDVNSTAVGISAIYSRSFAEQFKDGIGPLEIDRQASIVPLRELLKDNFEDQLNTNISASLNTSRHILKPFIVDPRIDLTVTPAVSRICVPFLEDKSKTQLSRGNYLKRPYLEKVLRVRFDSSNILVKDDDKPSIDQYVRDIIDFAKDNISVDDKHIVDSLSDTLNSLHKSEIVNIGKLTRTLEAFVLQLVNAQVQIDKIRTLINWKPIPNTYGPEFGSTINKVNPSDTDNNQKIEKDITQLEINKILSNTDFGIGLNQPDLGNFTFSDIDDIISDSTKHNVDFYDNQLSKLNARRNELGDSANNLLRKIEIITGEFSGLGLLDILAIQIALWSMSLSGILGLIDHRAFLRMQDIPQLRTDISPSSPLEALTEFEKKITEVYVLIGYFYSNAYESDKKNLR